jgi:hypothetical protein
MINLLTELNQSIFDSDNRIIIYLVNKLKDCVIILKISDVIQEFPCQLRIFPSQLLHPEF